MKDRVMFQTNVPKTVASAYLDGIQVEGRFGDQVTYTLMDERVMYIPPFVREKIGGPGVHQGEPFSICKSERRDGNRRIIEWLVGPVEVEDQKVAADGAVLKAGRASSSALKAKGKPNGHGDAARNGGFVSQALLRSALIASVEAAIHAEQYACAKELSVRE
jgi:hypothetical protein